MASLSIKFVGKRNVVYNVVDEVSFEKKYKPRGWVLVEEVQVKEPIKVDEKEIVEKAVAEKKKEKKVFDDKIIKGE
jgi:hypothetical protein